MNIAKRAIANMVEKINYTHLNPALADWMKISLTIIDSAPLALHSLPPPPYSSTLSTPGDWNISEYIEYKLDIIISNRTHIEYSKLDHNSYSAIYSQRNLF